MTLRKEIPALWTSMENIFTMGFVWNRPMVLHKSDLYILQQWIGSAFIMRDGSGQPQFKDPVSDAKFPFILQACMHVVL